MKTAQSGYQPFPSVAQTQKNSTLWIGHLPNDPADHLAGQTFTCPAPGHLDSIQLFAETVQHDGAVSLSVHEFDPGSKTWGSSLAQVDLDTRAKGRTALDRI